MHGDRQREAVAETRRLNIFPAERHQGRGLELGKPLSSLLLLLLLLLLKARFDPPDPLIREGGSCQPPARERANSHIHLPVLLAGRAFARDVPGPHQAFPSRPPAVSAVVLSPLATPAQDGWLWSRLTWLVLPLQEQERLAEGVRAAVLAAASVFYQLPKDQGTTLRRAVREATVEVVEGMIQLTEVILRTPLQSLSRDQLVSTGGVWEACDRVSSLPRDNQAAATLAISSCLGIVKDALEEMEQAQAEGGDPYGDVLEDEEVGSRGNKDVYWSEADRQLLGPCVGLVKAARACLKKVLGAVRAHGQAATLEQVAQLDDLADIAGDVSPSVDELVLSTYPPVNQLALRLNAGKLASVLKKMLEIARTSHVCPSPEEDWVRFLTGAVDHNMGRIKSLTQGLL
nr:cyclin-D1-binding protein 1 [Pogona vitticeps]